MSGLSINKAIVEGIIELARVFDLKIIAEGVETPEHDDLLLSLGRFIAQGYGIAKPIPEDDVLTWLALWKENPCLVDGSFYSNAPIVIVKTSHSDCSSIYFSY